MKIALFTVYSPAWLDLVNITIPNWLSYCAVAGYDLIVHPKPEKTERFYGWLRIEDLRQILFRDSYDAVVLLDADLIFTNFQKRFEPLIDPQHSLFITQDINGLNAGITIWKNNLETKTFLGQLLGDRDKFTGDQDAISYHHSSSKWVRSLTEILPQGEMNSYPYDQYPEGKNRIGSEGDWRSGHFIVHLPGLTNPRRIEIFNNLKQHIIS